MAHMIPRDPPPLDKPGAPSERDVFEALREQLDDGFFVYSRLSYIDDRNLAQGEADFLVLHRELGMLVIECKGEGVARDGTGKWRRAFRDGRREPMDEGPFEQAERTKYELIDKLKPRVARALPDRMTGRGDFPLIHGHAVAFPRAEADDLNLPLDQPRSLVFDSRDLDTLGDKVVAAMRVWRDKAGRAAPEPLEAKELKRFRKRALHPVLEIVETLDADIRADSRALLRLTRQQLKTVRGFSRNKRLRVLGGAGTGKTVLALEAARRFAGDGKSVLLVCYNNRLGDYLEASVDAWEREDDDGAVVADTFFRLCSKAHRDTHGKGLPVPEDRKEQERFWAEEAPYFLMEGVEGGAIPKVDAVVVDEGQDFAPLWWEILASCLKDPDGGNLLAFYDPSQEIFGRGCHVPDWATYELTYNFRNTQKIADVVRELGRVEMESYETCPVGEEPEEREQRSAAMGRKGVERLVGELTGKGGVPVERIAVLTPHTREHSCLKGLSELAGYELCDRPFDRTAKLLHTTIGAFKGLESDILILADIDPEDPRCDLNARYVAASRARHRLYVFSKGEWRG